MSLEKLWLQQFRISHIKAIKLLKSVWFLQPRPRTVPLSLATSKDTATPLKIIVLNIPWLNKCAISSDQVEYREKWKHSHWFVPQYIFPENILRRLSGWVHINHSSRPKVIQIWVHLKNVFRIDKLKNTSGWVLSNKC